MSIFSKLLSNLIFLQDHKYDDGTFLFLKALSGIISEALQAYLLPDVLEPHSITICYNQSVSRDLCGCETTK